MSQLPILETTLTWQNISAYTDKKEIVSNCSGYCQPGSMLAIMGPSGAGKTTLLSILAGKTSPTLTIKGKVEANKVKFSEEKFYNFGSFVFQNDILEQTLTVRETLQFICKMKIKSRQQALDRANQLINQFQLRGCSDTFVGGNIKKGISGGEKKRLCIAVQMVSKPSLLILDEPTSGLDSHTANTVIHVLRKLASERKTIIFTIHQPSYKIYSSLDRLILLNKGNTIYQGDAMKIKDYMMGLKINISQKSSISDFFMMEVSEYKAHKQNYKTPMNYETYSKVRENEVLKEIQKAKDTVIEEGYNEERPALARFYQFQLLFMRQFKIFMRNPMKFYRSIGNALLSIIIVGLIFYNGVMEDRPDVSQTYESSLPILFYFIKVQGICFVNIVNVIMTGIFSVSLVFPTQREVFAKQRASKAYSTLPYFISKLIFEGASIIFSVFIFTLGAYWLVGYQRNAVQFFTYILILFVMALVGNSIGFLTGSLFKDAKNASSLAPALLLPLMMFSGLYNKLDSIPVYISWLQYISPFRYGLHSLLINEFGNEVYKIDGNSEYNYKSDLSIDLSLQMNLLICLGLSVFYYSLAYLFLRKLSSKLAA